MKKRRVVLLMVLMVPLFFLAQNRYWVASSTANWNSNNWSTSSGGSPDGLGAPSGSETAVFNSGGLGNCNLSTTISINNLRILTGYTSIIDLNGNTLNLIGASTSYFQDGTVTDTPGTAAVNFNSSGRVDFLGTTFNASITGVASVINFGGGIFNDIVNIESNAAGSAYGTGGCVFNDNVKLTNSGTGYFLMGSSNPDIFNGTLELVNSSTSRIRIGYSSLGNEINENLIVSNTGGGVWFGENGGTITFANSKTISIGTEGFSDGELRFRNFNQIGTTPQNLSLTGNAILRFQSGTIFNGNVNFDAPRIYLDGITCNGTSEFEKTGAVSDGSIGGNSFVGDVILRNSGSGYFLMGNTSPDIFNNNLTMFNTSSDAMYIGNNSAGNSIGGDFVINNTSTGSSHIYIANATTSSLAVAGNLEVYNNGFANYQNVFICDDGDVTIGGDLLIENAITGTATSSQVFISNGSNASVTVTGSTIIKNGGSSSVSRVYLGNQGDVTFNGVVNLTNSSSANLSDIFCNYNSTSLNTYNENIILSSTNSLNEGIYFGRSEGVGVLAANKTITVGTGGFIGENLIFRNFTQLGSLAQNLELTGTDTRFELHNAIWGGNVNFKSAAMYTRDSRFKGTAVLTKTGTSSNHSNGGNQFDLDLTMNNTGTNIFALGNVTSDSFGNDVFINNTGSGNTYIAYDSPGNTVARDLIIENSGSGVYSNVQISAGTSASITIGRNCSVLNNSAAITADVYLGNNGTSFVINGDLSIDNNTTGSNGRIYLAQNNVFTLNGDLDINNRGTSNSGIVYLGNGSSSNVTINGVSTISNTGTGSYKYIYLGNSGDVTFNDDLTISNSALATHSRVYSNQTSTSSNAYNGNIIVESTNANADGIYFGNGSGVGVLAANKTVTLGAGGYVAGELYFRNFTQTGNTAHSIILDVSGTGTFYNYDSDWGGDVVFSGPSLYTRGTLYRGTADLSKTGAVNNNSIGGNVFSNDLNLSNSGSDYLIIGNSIPDDFQGNVTINNTGSDHIHIAYSSIGNKIAGNLIATNSATGSTGNVSICNSSSAEISIDGNVTLLNNGTASSNSIYLGNAGEISSIGGNLLVTNNTTGTTGNVYLASSDTLNLAGNLTINNTGTSTNNHVYLSYYAGSHATIGGATTVLNSGSGNISRIYLSNQGSAVFNGELAIKNSSTANYSEVHCNYNVSSNNTFNENIIVESTTTVNDGVYFGAYNGSATLAANKTVTIGTNQFIAGELRFRNFTQTGSTPQTLNLLNSGTAFLNSYDSNWGGDIVFTAPRIETRGTTYNGTTYLEKTGAINDGSNGGNTFTGISELKNTGSGLFRMGEGNPDIFLADLTMNNLGTDDMHLAYSSAGNSIAGDFYVNNLATGTNSTDIIVSGYSNSTIAIAGNVILDNAATSSNSYVYFGDNGSVDVQGTLDVINQSTSSNTSEVRVANQTSSAVNLVGDVTVLNNGNSNYNRTYFYNNGDGTIDGSVMINNSSAGSNGSVSIGNGTNSTVTFNSTVDVFNSGNSNLKQVHIGNQGDLTFNGVLSVSNTATANSSFCYLNYNSASNNSYNENVIIESYGANCDGIQFGRSAGFGTLASGKTISLGPNGYTDGHLYFRNFTQLGGTAQSITTTNNSRIEQYNSTWNGTVSFVSPRIHTAYTTYNGITYLEKTGANSDASTGANTYNAAVTFKNTGTGYFMPTNNNASDHNADVTYIKASSGLVYPTYSAASTYAGNIYFDGNASINFAANSGTVVMDGTSAQSITNIGAALEPNFRRLRTNNSLNEITLNTPINVQTELDLIAGNIISTSTNFISMRNDATVTTVSDNAYVDGPILKMGNDLFSFPVGKAGVYRPIEISAPSSNSAEFKAEFFAIDPQVSGFNHSSKDANLDHVSNCEYWVLDRVSSTNSVIVKLSYDSYGSYSCSGVTDQSELAVTRWDGTKWKDHGNGGFGGTPADGWVTSAGAITSFSPFTLASTTTNNPLPIELLTFTAEVNETVVDVLWETASEIDNDYFTVERSNDGINFTAIDKIIGAGNSNQIIDYSTVDNNPLKGLSYYRLKQTDFNGEFTYSNIAVVNFKEANTIAIYPNPVKDILTIDGLSFDDAITIYGLDGKLVYKGTSNIVNAESFSNGVYQLVISHSNGSIDVIKFVK